MNMQASHRRRLKGFTVVELIIVVSVIGILASIVLITYPGYQKRARDAERKSDVSQIAAALGAYALQKNTYVATGSGCGLNGNGNGWFNVGPSEIAAYPKSIATCLQETGALKDGTFIDPLNCKFNSGGTCGVASVPSQAYAYMKATCKTGGNDVTYVMAHLENDPANNATIDALCDAGTVSGYDATTQKWGTNYGMNYYVTAK